MKQVKENLYWVGALHPDLRVFDVIMHTKYGTSYNAFILKTNAGNVLFETVKVKFFDDFLKKIEEVCPVESISHIVVDHTEPDHVGSLEKLLDLAPQAQVVGSAVALNFLRDICNRPIPGIAVDHNATLDIGGERLRFLSVPFLHWPDSIYTYLEKNKTLITCDSFGCHYSDERVFNDTIDGDFYPAYKYYFDMIMGPFKKHVRYALEQIEPLDFDTICPGHGPVLRTDLDYYIDLYRKWSQEEEIPLPEKPQVVNAFVSAYGYTEELARHINSGIAEVVDADIHTYDMVHADAQEVQKKIDTAQGLLLGSCTINGDALPPVMDLAMGLNGIAHGGKVAAAYGSYGWSGEGPEVLNYRLRTQRMNTLEPPLRVKFKPSQDDTEKAVDFGRRFGKKIQKEWEQMGRTGSDGKTFWKCTVCGEVFEGALPPTTCPVCGVGSEAFVEHAQDVVTYSDDRPQKMVIVGSGAAAISAAEAIRARNSAAEIHLYTAEDILPYYRPVLTDMLSRSVEDEEFFLHPEHYYAEKILPSIFQAPWYPLQRQKKEIILESGAAVSYDKLLLATGADPFVPPVKGRDLAGVHTIRSRRDITRLQERFAAPGNRKILVVGGGLLGLETACGLAQNGAEVLVVDTAPRILPRQTDGPGAEFLMDLVKESSIEIITDTVVQEIYGHENRVEGVILATGENIQTDLVVVSAGLKPSVDLAEGTAISTGRAIEVNDRMETGARDIYAAGDCAIFNECYYGIWEPALEQGRVAGANMAGDEKRFAGKKYPATLHAFGTSLFALGDIHLSPQDKDVTIIRRRDDLKKALVTYYFQKNRLCGALFIGDLSKSAPVITGVNEKITYEDALDEKML
ncbi:FAD-dependent oxidoreductase [Chitinivibrio alkaliphilus]|uniref:Rubredoxin/flavodoxin/oxidoreductase n=1 Tax=Chitinivibrio alkaliphilus ACht1 TaxID=1313304 RepID=U7D4H9_9BACT|nr:FAD-dependent oxidoreductase [Chitinivibrio alkaliphilus]ERP30833.1 rubredoxin/flavodoxin/oxidoreductase [Chitinivibrio alkaliphilus ACht1]